MWTRETFVDWEKMAHFCPEHLACLATIAALVAGLPLLARKHLSEATAQRLGLILGWVSASGYLVWLPLVVLAGAFEPQRDLPLEFCYLIGLVAPAAMAFRSQMLFDFFYYCGLSGVLHACITPVFAPSFPHPRSFAFWALHGGVVVTIAFAVGALGRRPTFRGIFTTFGWLVALLAIVIPVNGWLDANYFYLREKPAGSVQELLGPWPVYVFGTIALGLTNFMLAYLPFRFLSPRPAAA